MSLKIVEAAKQYIQDNYPEFIAEQSDANTLIIHSVYYVGKIVYWPTTGSFRLEKFNDTSIYSFSGKKVSLVELIKEVKRHG